MKPRGLRATLTALTIALPLVATATGAYALNIFGFTLFEDRAATDAAAVIADPQPYEVALNVNGGSDDIRATIEGASALWKGRNAPASGAAGLLATARGDYKRIVTALYGQGYYGGAVTITVDGTEATKLPPDADLGDPARVAVRVETGPQFRFGSTEIVNAAPAPGTVDDAVAAPASEGFAPGEIAKSGAIRRAALLAVRAWRQQGYPKAEIGDQEIVADHATTRVNVRLTVTPGPRARIGSVAVSGAQDVNPDFIARQTGLEPGKEYDPDDIERAKVRLAELEVFNAIQVEEAETVAPDGTLPLTIVVQERAPRRVGVGATFSTTDGLGVETFFLHRNLLGEAERLRLDARLAGIGYPVQTADFDYYFGGTFTKPGLGTPETDLVASLVGQRTVLDHYTERSVEGRLGLTHDVSNDIKVNGGVHAKHANFFDKTYGTRDFNVLGAYGGVTFDTRNDTTDPTSGIYADLKVEPFYEFSYNNAAIRAEAEGRLYWALDPDERFVLAGRAKIGAILGPSLAETPPDKLFFAGGGGSVRGYPYRSIGVDAGGGNVTGGKFLTEASLEARARVTDTIGLVGFVDAGYVTANNFVGLSEGTRIGVGAGLRYYTGFGPLRLDVAVPVNKRPDDSNYALYVGIGQAF